MTNEIDPSALNMPVQGLHLHGPKLGNQIAEKGTLLVFLRHFGCLFSREMVTELKSAAQAPGYPEVIFVYNGSIEDGQYFFGQFWADASAISDPNLKLYNAFNVGRAGLRELLNPDVLLCGLRAMSKGNLWGIPKSDPLTMPGIFLLKDKSITWEHDFAHVGDHPKFSEIPNFL
jgi:hypothetical protein